ncbi:MULTISPECIES: Bug family tripartite tricarboxylate transporter substrate binding protein [Comamonas]|uniref:Tripartite tricarboxylate transporter family receptor n=1 Tax=Comamonas testosteroni TaxID=285 RepID=A0A8B4S0V5_COMTE|nr:MULTISPECIES: tripartite tricarboxylate transporter substrate-binding protein [Comamonas]EHN65162.1 TctC [Comamonas testosteroni ATCC 11996]KKI14982.1 twin-arginine translocation pathway signal protein [Comamonas thiooxydans]QQN69877.1 tripartite tricarboxylate transporter substrate binding protein [Comamonas testosteroni]SUY76254.1 Tripartite tricarboxylate transporter family receptor [Comamonas testosteroni]
MNTIQANRFPTRRQWLGYSAALLSTPFAAIANPPQRLGTQLRIVIPANPGGGWDQTGRALGAALTSSGTVDKIIYENIGGKGGTIGLAEYTKRYGSDPNSLLIGGMVMVGALALNKKSAELHQVQPLARLTSDYLVVAVPTDSPLANPKALAKAMRENLPALTIAGGSAGGVDHMYAGMLARLAKANAEQLQYKPFAGGNDVLQALLQKQVQVGISGYSEFREALQAGKLRALGVSSRRAMFGIASMRDQGLDAEMSNWRAVFTGKNLPAERAQQLLAAIDHASNQDSWKQALVSNNWNSSWQTGKALHEFLEVETSTAQLMTYLLKLKS